MSNGFKDQEFLSLTSDIQAQTKAFEPIDCVERLAYAVVIMVNSDNGSIMQGKSYWSTAAE